MEWQPNTSIYLWMMDGWNDRQTDMKQIWKKSNCHPCCFYKTDIYCLFVCSLFLLFALLFIHYFYHFVFIIMFVKNKLSKKQDNFAFLVKSYNIFIIVFFYKYQFIFILVITFKIYFKSIAVIHLKYKKRFPQAHTPYLHTRCSYVTV